MRRSRVLRTAMIAVIALGCSSCLPLMEEQPSVAPYQRELPDMPAGSVPTAGRLATLTARESKLARNPLSRTAGNLRNGRTYYRYYCLACHGENGKGDGPVGVLYIPTPADLTSSAVTKLTDGELYHSMLYGIGHEPVMSKTVLPSHRWQVVMYVRTLGERPAQAARVMPVSGKTVFQNNCVVCHGAKGDEIPGWHAKVRQMTMAQVKNQIRNGGGGMPPFKNKLSPQQIDAAAKYAKQLAGR